jgi:hypothetical protein
MFMFWHLEGTGLRGIDKGGLYFSSLLNEWFMGVKYVFYH